MKAKWLFVAIVIASIQSLGQTSGSGTAASKSVVVVFARNLNTDAAKYRISNGKYPTWEEIVKIEASKKPASN